MGISNALDRLIGVFSPTTELKRVSARKYLERAKYAAAQSTPSTHGWKTISNGDSSVNDTIQSSIHTLRTRARQLVRDMPAMSAAIDRIVEHQVGTGIKFRAMVKNNSDDKLDKALNQKIEDALKYAMDEMDYGGQMHFYDQQQLACRQSLEVGEFDFVKKRLSRNNRFIPFALQMFEPDVISAYGPTAKKNNIIEGVEYDMSSGRPIAYHFQDPELWKKTVRILPDNMVIGFKFLRPNQLRGITPLAPVMLLAHSMRDFLESELNSAQKAAKWLAFVTTPDPQSTMKAFGDMASTTYTDSNSNSVHTMEMGNAIVDFLKTGEKVDIASHNRPGNSFDPFVKFLHQTFAATIGATYELVSGNYELKYTGARVARNDMNRSQSVSRARLVRQLCDPVRREVMDWCVLTGRLNLPNYFTNPYPYLRGVWMDDGQQPIDPLREGRADSDALKDKRMSPQEIIIKRGRDPEEVLDDWQEWQEMLEDRGLDAEEVETGLQTNPAAVGAAEGDGKKNLLRIAK